MFPLCINDSIEAREYLRGVLFSDPDTLKDPDVNADVIDPYGTGNKAFWRGVMESAGHISMPGVDRYRYPRVELKATPVVLHKLIAFISEENANRVGLGWKWDSEDKIAWQANGGFFRVTGQKAQEVTFALYLGATVSRVSTMQMANQIISWLPVK